MENEGYIENKVQEEQRTIMYRTAKEWMEFEKEFLNDDNTTNDTEYLKEAIADVQEQALALEEATKLISNYNTTLIRALELLDKNNLHFDRR
jgi:type IV secretory pathway component VirB8